MIMKPMVVSQSNFLFIIPSLDVIVLAPLMVDHDVNEQERTLMSPFSFFFCTYILYIPHYDYNDNRL